MHKDDVAAALARLQESCRSQLRTMAFGSDAGDSVPTWRDLIRILTDIEFSEEDADARGRRILAHQGELQTRLGRPVDIRLALLDYFTTVDAELECPKIVEMEHYLGTLRYGSADPLTGLANRRHMEEQLEREINRARRYDLEFSLLYADLDDFKGVNDNYGHATGDEVLRTFAEHLRNYLRREDLAARYGGEEFLVLMPRTDLEGAHCLSQRLLEELRRLRIRRDLVLTFSGGISTFPRHGGSPEALLQHADRGLYRAKMTGKNRIVVEPPEKRRHERIAANRRVRYVESAQSSVGMGTARDISLSGVRIATDREPRAGEYISISLELGESGDSYRIGAQVVWVRKRREPGDVEFGAEYAAPNQETAERLFSAVSADRPPA